MKKLFIAILTATTFLVNALPSFAFYSDVTEETPYYEAIKTLYDLGKLPEYEDNEFNPDSKLKITDLYELIIGYNQILPSNTPNLPFSDTDNSASYAPYIQEALDLNILSGTSLTLGINKQVSKYSALSIIFKALGIGPTYFFDKDSFPFTDIGDDSRIAPVAIKANEIGIQEQDHPSLFRMAKRITKGETADYLYKIYKYSQEKQITITIDQSSSSYTEAQKQLLDSENFKIMLDVWENLKTNFLYKDSLNDEELITAAIKGLVEEIDDPYTSFQDPTEASNLLQTLSSNEYEGVGMTVDLIDNNVTIISPMKDSPAEKAGLKPYDILTKVDDEDITGLTLETVVSKIKGPAGTQVKLTIKRDSEELEFNITRSSIIYKNVTSEIKKNGSKKIGYIDMISFGEDAYSEFVEAANALIEEDPKGLIIDLRNNPGGYMDIAIAIIGLFTDENKTAVTLEFSDGNQTSYKTDGNGLLKGYKTVVLINAGSASASEILAGALKDYGVAKIIGEKSFGKGCVQELSQYSDGSLFKYTISKWLTPNGTDIDKKGITPDEVVENTDKGDKQLEEALKEF